MYYYKLKKKSIICIEGKDATTFIQGIITNNTNKLKINRVIYSTLLSPQGKLLHDFFLFKDMEKIYLDAPRYNINKLKEKLNLYKLNRDISISEKRIYSYFLFFGKLTNKTLGLSKKLGELKKVNSARIFNDPRNINLGSRIICNNKKDENKVIQIIKNKKIVLNSQEYEKYLNLSKLNIANELYNTYDSYIKKRYKIDINYQALNTVKNYFN